MEKLLPTLMIALSIGAAIMYLTTHDYRRAMYWVFAAGLTATVTY